MEYQSNRRMTARSKKITIIFKVLQLLTYKDIPANTETYQIGRNKKIVS